MINAGGIINVSMEVRPEGYDQAQSTKQVLEIYQTLLTIFARAEQTGQPTNLVADQMAQEIIARGKK